MKQVVLGLESAPVVELLKHLDTIGERLVAMVEYNNRKRVVSLRELLDYLRVSRDLVWMWGKEGVLRPVDGITRRGFRWGEVLDLLEANLVVGDFAPGRVGIDAELGEPDDEVGDVEALLEALFEVERLFAVESVKAARKWK